ncbi:MAG TPA: T9SS type A sorting domain-containing protein, partial [Segetibacter sp.]
IDEKSSALKLYPNPNKGQFMVELHLSNNINANAKIELLNMMGQTVSTINASINNGTLYKNVSISSSLAAGMYIAKITVNNKTYLARVVYQK